WIGRNTESATTLCQCSVPERASPFLGTAAFREDGAAGAGRLTLGMDHLYVVLPGRVAGWIRIQPRGAAMAWCPPTGSPPWLYRLAAAPAAPHRCAAGRRRFRNTPADHVASDDRRHHSGTAVRGAGLHGPAASAVVLCCRQQLVGSVLVIRCE